MVVRLPGPVDNLQHAWFWRLWISEEEDRTRQVQPGVCHQLWFVEQRADIAVHRFRERTIVIVVRQLFRTATEVAQEIAVFVFTARPGLTLPDVRVTFAVIAALLAFTPAHFTHVHQRLTPFCFRTPAFVPPRFLRKVSKHGCQLFTANGIAVAAVFIGVAQCREFAHRFQEVAVAVILRAQWEQVFPVALFQDPFNAFYVIRVCRTAWLNLLNLSVVQRTDSILHGFHQREIGERFLLFRQIAGFHGVRLAVIRLQHGGLSNNRCYACTRNKHAQ